MLAQQRDLVALRGCDPAYVSGGRLGNLGVRSGKTLYYVFNEPYPVVLRRFAAELRKDKGWYRRSEGFGPRSISFVEEGFGLVRIRTISVVSGTLTQRNEGGVLLLPGRKDQCVVVVQEPPKRASALELWWLEVRRSIPI